MLSKAAPFVPEITRPEPRTLLDYPPLPTHTSTQPAGYPRRPAKLVIGNMSCDQPAIDVSLKHILQVNIFKLRLVQNHEDLPKNIKKITSYLLTKYPLRQKTRG